MTYNKTYNMCLLSDHADMVEKFEDITEDQINGTFRTNIIAVGPLQLERLIMHMI
jgi:hypothetical protein